MGQQYDDNELRKYLLGRLPEAEREVFDELSIVDDIFVERLDAIEDDLIDDYVYGEISGTELAQFESHYLASPHRREKVKFAQAFQPFAEKKILEKEARTTVTEPETSVLESDVSRPRQFGQAGAESVPRRRSARNLFILPNLRFQWGLTAAAMLLLIAGGWLAIETLRLRGRLEQGETERAALERRERELQAQMERQQSAGLETKRELERVREKLAQLERQRLPQQRAGDQPPRGELKIVPFDLAMQMRAIGKDVILTIPPGTDYVTLQLEVESDDHPAYRAELRTQTGNRKVWSAGRLKSRARGQNRVIDVSIRADRLTTRGYILLLKGIAADGSVKDAPSYAFRVVKP
ncbi:MAG TPA: hypothetical protein VJ810_25120 [Blastocatellia bacterium]|nr:hypothetical protein [Blastocatellia bacterium]